MINIEPIKQPKICTFHYSGCACHEEKFLRVVNELEQANRRIIELEQDLRDLLLALKRMNNTALDV
jgi:hypothetical protein